MQDLMATIIGNGFELAALTMIFVEVIKAIDVIPSKFIPIVSIIIGAVIGLVFAFCGYGNMLQLIFSGVVSGGVASGTYMAITHDMTRISEDEY
jgi:ABC-type enterochelin transport system permease subunit